MLALLGAALAAQPTLQVFHVASGHLPRRLVLGEGGEPVDVVIFSAVITHPEHGVVVIDPGYGRRTAADPNDIPGRSTVRSTGLQMHAPLVEQLATAGIGPVSRVFVTHMHVDHSAALADLPDATLNIDPAEWAFASRDRAVRAVVAPEDHATRPVEPLLFDDGAYGPFAAHEDVFGDGTLIALPAPGHTPGHTAFLINLPGGAFLMTGDAVWVDENLTTKKGWLARSLIEVDGGANQASVAALAALIEATENLTVLTGHDPENLHRAVPGEVYR